MTIELKIAFIATLASMFSATAAWIAALSSFLYNRKRLRIDMHNENGGLANSRFVFWTWLNIAYEQFRKSNPKAPEQLVDLIRKSGTPPNMITRNLRELRLWSIDNLDKLDFHQQTLWDFASYIYSVSSSNIASAHMQLDGSIKGVDKGQFFGARIKLETFWDAWTPIMSIRYLSKRYTLYIIVVIIIPSNVEYDHNCNIYNSYVCNVRTQIMRTISYYDVLGIAENATLNEIKKAYHEKSTLYHPDKHHNNPLYKLAEEKQIDLNEAYEVLSDPIKRRIYNQEIHRERKVAGSQKPEYNEYNEYNGTNANEFQSMILIPAGEFQMGDAAKIKWSSEIFSMTPSLKGYSNERPVNIVYLDAFYLDKHEVTNEQYKKFMDATGYKAPDYWDDPNFNIPNHPVVGVSWFDAEAYCKWAGKRLPTEAEWEKAARGVLVGRIYPCGDSLSHNDANYGGTFGKDGWEFTSPVGSFAPNGYGLYDMAGNVNEWCSDWYDENYYKEGRNRYNKNYPLRSNNPKGPHSGSTRVARGGSWRQITPGGYGYGPSRDPSGLRVSNRYGYHSPTSTYNDVGFRCAMDIPK
jgi:formylglycine-generating enzyme required for sulfatase activity